MTTIINEPNDKASLVEIVNVTKAYQNKKALSNFSLTLEPGHIVGLLGPNGSGKTTLMKILTGVLKDYTGSVTIKGEPIGAKTKALVSYLPDVSYFSAWMRPLDVIALFKDFYSDFDEAKCLEMVKRLDLDEKQRIKTMSKGMIE